MTSFFKKDDIVNWGKTFYNDADVAKYLWGIAFHWYFYLSFISAANVQPRSFKIMLNDLLPTFFFFLFFR